jgi:hypothetical protein
MEQIVSPSAVDGSLSAKPGDAAPGNASIAVELRLDPAQLRRWHFELMSRLESEGIAHVVAVSHGKAPALPASVALLLRLERMVRRLPGPHRIDELGADALQRPWPSGETPDIVLDFTGDAKLSGSALILRILYDGLPGEASLMGALLEGRAPLVGIEAAGEGSVVAQGLPSIETAESLTEAVEAVQARVVTILTSALRRPLVRMPHPSSRAGSAGTRATAEFALRTLPRNAVRALYRLCYFAPHWRIGWRFVGERDLLDARSLEGANWKVLPDPGSHFYADPFPIVWQGRRFIFVEDLDHRIGKGVISAVEIDDNGPRGMPSPVLEEASHLSYPFLIEHAGSIWMIPESSARRTVDLYRAEAFPSRWTKEATLLSGIEASDATILRHGERLWMFATTRDGTGSYSDTLSLFSATDLFGPWSPHPANPVLVDARSARSAGNIVRRNERLWRPVQDCSSGYGSALGIAEITRLDESGYEQVVRTVLKPGHSWPGRRFHTLNRAGDLECIDGSADSSRLRWAAGRLFRR